MTKIENLEQLQDEIKKLRELAKKQELQIKNDLFEIRDDLKPQNILLNALSSLTGIKINKKEFFQEGILSGLSLFLRRFVLKTEKKMENKFYDVVDGMLDKFKSLVNKFAGPDARRAERRDD